MKAAFIEERIYVRVSLVLCLLAVLTHCQRKENLSTGASSVGGPSYAVGVPPGGPNGGPPGGPNGGPPGGPNGGPNNPSSSTTTYSGYNSNAIQAFCVKSANLICDKSFTQGDQFNLDCRNSGGTSYQCGCHAYLCSLKTVSASSSTETSSNSSISSGSSLANTNTSSSSSSTGTSSASSITISSGTGTGSNVSTTLMSYSGFNSNALPASCAVPSVVVCDQTFNAGDQFANDCRIGGGQPYFCGCHYYLCSKNFTSKNFSFSGISTSTSTSPQSSNEMYSGYNIDGQAAQCTSNVGNVMCDYLFTPNDQFANICQAAGGSSLFCGCHNYLCTKPIYSGYDLNHNATYCPVPTSNPVCDNIATPQDAYAARCTQAQGKVYQCGCHNYLCSIATP